ncbi:MAG: tyrosine--tRNA ligase [Cytophagales bacterium]|nr:tyrosine--tRNA ligase [Cytophagales bacterium]
MKNFVEELRWRGMLHDIMPGTEEQFMKEMCAAYVGFDPTADSLHIGHLVSVMMLKHLQDAGHKPVVVIGGATGMIGDPSGKSEERNLLTEEVLNHNVAGVRKQFEKLLNFNSSAENAAELVNNYDWTKNYSFIDFAREIGKHITVNYMMGKESVKKRLAPDSGVGMSFTEFTYQLLQGYDFLWLYENKGCRLQMGGSDQWGNITTGTELIRRKTQGEAFALTCPLITKSDGKKFGKTESGNVWLDPEKTTPYAFYQFWLNTSDEDAERYIKIFTYLGKEEIEALVTEHNEAPHQRALQQRLAKEVTIMVHSEHDYEMAVKASQILFGKSTTEDLASLDEATFLAVFEGVTKAELSKEEFNSVANVTDLVSVATGGVLFKSKGEARKMIKGGGVSVNKTKVTDSEQQVEGFSKLMDKYILLQKGKKNYFIIEVK